MKKNMNEIRIDLALALGYALGKHVISDLEAYFWNMLLFLYSMWFFDKRYGMMK